MSPVPRLNEHIRQLEEQLLQPEIRGSKAALVALLADDFVEFASDGAAYTKAQVIDALQREVPYVRSLSDFHLVALGDEVALATYRSTRREEPSGQHGWGSFQKSSFSR
jgi:hypothetical protein